jgi:hypothetical protein
VLRVLAVQLPRTAAGITVDAAMTATATGLLMQHAASDGAITSVRTGRSEPVGPTKTT